MPPSRGNALGDESLPLAPSLVATVVAGLTSWTHLGTPAPPLRVKRWGSAPCRSYGQPFYGLGIAAPIYDLRRRCVGVADITRPCGRPTLRCKFYKSAPSYAHSKIDIEKRTARPAPFHKRPGKAGPARILGLATRPTIRQAHG